jgi:putative Mg2+ transporter-C (MgtC) family protein
MWDQLLLQAQSMGADLLRILLAYVLSLPLAWNREHQGHSAGLRTFPLVAIAAAGYSLVGLEVFDGALDAQSRLLQGLLAGMGFIGGGAILRTRGSVHGTATAASIWCTAAIGVACAYRTYHIALFLSVVGFVTLQVMARVKSELHHGNAADPQAP